MQSSKSVVRFPNNTPAIIRVMGRCRRAKNGCLEFTGSRDNSGSGYGWVRITIDGKRTSKGAHCIVWEYNYGLVPEGMQVCHSCDNKICCEFTHLFLGTPLNNTQDARRKGLLTGPINPVHGSAHHKSRLNHMQVITILLSDKPTALLAREYGVTYHAVDAIRKRRSWKHVEIYKVRKCCGKTRNSSEKAREICRACGRSPREGVGRHRQKAKRLGLQ